MAKLIILRGNSGSGKTTVAKALQARLGHNTMLISQDVVRREMLKVRDGADTKALPLLKELLRYGREHCEIVILEGILRKDWYLPLFELAGELYGDGIYAYYYDLPFEETLSRHGTRLCREEFGEEAMRRWWVEKDYLGIKGERILHKEKGMEDTVNDIYREVWGDGKGGSTEVSGGCVENMGDECAANIRVALLQLMPEGTLEGNLRKGIDYCRQAKELGADIALFPEMWNCGYEIPEDIDRLRSLAIGKGSDFVLAYKELARELDMAVGITFLETFEPRPRNTICLIDRFGREVYTYAKVHTCDFGEECRLTPGEEFYVEDLDTAKGSVKVGSMICYDREFPESARILMLKGAELLLVPNACPMEINRISQLRGRAYENMVGIATVNYPGGQPDCNGHSTAFDGIAYRPSDSGSRDTLIVEADESEGIFLADFPIEEIREYRGREVHGNAYRRPEKYGILVSEEIHEPFVREDRRKRVEVRFYEGVDDELLKFAVVIGRSEGKYVFCKHRDRNTWEFPGGHREPGETILEAARRELYEETGAVDFDLKPVCVYSVRREDKLGGEESFGMLYYGEIREFEGELHSEIEKIVIADMAPGEWTYPDILPRLLEEAGRRGFLEG
jgi:predicted amidohydrolase/8-oxo-dGTP pyrophosphatase MutT (NUDIX family)/predicted kinase